MIVREQDANVAPQCGAASRIGLSQADRSRRSKLPKTLLKLQEQLRNEPITVDRVARLPTRSRNRPQFFWKDSGDIHGEPDSNHHDRIIGVGDAALAESRRLCVPEKQVVRPLQRKDTAAVIEWSC